jgi:hypothetical protein
VALFITVGAVCGSVYNGRCSVWLCFTMQTVVRPDNDNRDLTNVHAEYFEAACHGSDR